MDLGCEEDEWLQDVLGGDDASFESSACHAGVGSVGGRRVLLFDGAKIAQGTEPGG
jgi:hypothetical protein